MFTVCFHAGGVPFSSLSPFLFRYILNCLRGSFSIKRETDRDRTDSVCVFVCSIILNNMKTMTRGKTSVIAVIKKANLCCDPLGEHPAAMHQEHVGELHQAPSHHTCWLHICWSRVLDTTGMISLSTIYSYMRATHLPVKGPGHYRYDVTNYRIHTSRLHICQ